MEMKIKEMTKDRKIKKNQVIFDPGALPLKNVEKISEVFGDRITFISTAEICDQPEFFFSVNYDQYPHLEKNYCPGRLHASPEKIWDKVINDHVTFMLFDRWYRNLQSNSLKVAYVIEACIKCQYYLEENDPDLIIYRAAPHSIFTWIFAQVAEELDIKVLYFLESAIPWRFYLCESRRKEPSILSPQKTNFNEQEYLMWIKYVEEKKGTATEALPIYEQKRLKINKGKIYNPLKDFQKNWKRPDLLLNKYICYKAYKKLSVKSFSYSKYVVFFLHYQPERTTLPEGYGFSQQLAAIRLIVASLPNDVKLLVKEHPSTFTNNCDWTQRLPSFYKTIAALPNTSLVSIGESAYDLIDKSEAIATITGTVAFEALVRGKPSIVFGGGPLQFVKNPLFHRYVNIKSLKIFFERMYSEKANKNWVEDYFCCMTRKSYSGWDGSKKLEQVKITINEANGVAVEKGMQEISENLHNFKEAQTRRKIK